MSKIVEKNNSEPGLSRLSQELMGGADKARALILQRFFKTGPGQYGAGDVFLGVSVPIQRKIAVRYGQLGFTAIEKLLSSPYHEFRLAGLLILVRQYEKADDRATRKKIVDFYLAHTERINNWDLVDLSAYKIVGDFLVKEAAAKRSSAVVQHSSIVSLKVAAPVLFKLSRSKNLWERRIAMVSTFAFIKDGQPEVAFAVAEKLLGDKHDLMHKAVGWMLREAGKRGGQEKLTAFLDRHAAKMPRTALRYAIERFSQKERAAYLKK
jgi:3-methyladenine DNA glycosylase AlkD